MACIYVLVVVLCHVDAFGSVGHRSVDLRGVRARQILELEYFTAKGTTQQDLK